VHWPELEISMPDPPRIQWRRAQRFASLIRPESIVVSHQEATFCSSFPLSNCSPNSSTFKFPTRYQWKETRLCFKHFFTIGISRIPWKVGKSGISAFT